MLCYVMLRYRASNNYKMHFVLSCSTLSEKRENMLENIYMYLMSTIVLFENQDSELQFLFLMGCVYDRSFEKICKMEAYETKEE